VTTSEIRNSNYSSEKLEWWDGLRISTIRLAILTLYQRVTDMRTDRQKDSNAITVSGFAYSYACVMRSRDKIMYKVLGTE